MEFYPITLPDRAVFDAAYRRCRHEGSESSFTNLFIWRKPLDIVWTRIGPTVCVVVRRRTGGYHRGGGGIVQLVSGAESTVVY